MPVLPSSVTRAALVLLLVAASALAGCQPRPVEVTEEDDGASVRLDVGQELRVMLESNPSTGYTWVVEEDTSGILESAGEPTWEASDPSAVGSPGMSTLVFEGVRPGQTELVLSYRRPWEMTVTPDASFSLDVAVD
jgi:inhibitor of cysteine peptidase